MSVDNFKYDLLFELSPDLLCIAGYDGYFKKVNPAVATLLGYTFEELYARPINDFVHPEDKIKTAQARSELTKAKPLLHFENRYVTKSGETVWLSWTSLPIESDELIFAIAKDITLKKQQEVERNALLANLTQANTDLKQLTYTTSHDLRSPVNNLVSLVDLIDVTRINDPETIRLLEFLKSTGSKLKHTLNAYIDEVSEKNRVHVPVEEVDLHESLNDILQSIHVLVQTSRATIRADFSKLKTLHFNKAYLKSVLLNLITNSIKYSQPRVLPVISIYSEKGNGEHRLIVEDNGLGFDMENVKDKLFGLHQKFHNHTDSKGIGLYLVHTHVTSLGGHIAVESKINRGTKFIISFQEPV